MLTLEVLPGLFECQIAWNFEVFVFLGETLDGADGIVSIDELRIVQNAALGTAHDTALGLTI